MTKWSKFVSIKLDLDIHLHDIHFHTTPTFHLNVNRISGVMVSVLASSVVDRVKPKTIKLVFVASPLSTQQ
jgi:hypothetical protein